MTEQGLEVIDHSVHLTHEWINELAGRLGWSSKRSALRLMRTVLHRIRDHLLLSARLFQVGDHQALAFRFLIGERETELTENLRIVPLADAIGDRLTTRIGKRIQDA